MTGYLNIKETAEKLNVNIETLILWNENNILKPTITLSGEVGYREEQINQFLAIQQQLKNISQNNAIENGFVPKFHPLVIFLVFVLSFSLTVGVSLTFLNGLTGEKEPQKIISSVPVNEEIQLDKNPVQNEVFRSGLNGIVLQSYTESVNFAPGKIRPEGENAGSVYNYDGLIGGENPDTKVLAAATLANGSAQNGSPIKQIVNLDLLLAVLTLGSLAMILIFRKPGVDYGKNRGDGPEIPQTGTDLNAEGQKIIEVSQKTDGTVVLYFRGKEFKVSKPELDSESDQFMERLMEMVKPGVKEIDYNTITDEGMKFSAPLSKIVTRLGFVGLKRDLFFPRTSKNRVLFRRYLTYTDIQAMNLDPDQVKNEFME